jgi:SAM-dependent methyltransferase
MLSVVVVVAYVPFDPLRAPASSSSTVGWDAWSDDYADLGAKNAGYALGKRLLQSIVDDLAPGAVGRETRVLDFNCGAGDDVARFLARGWHVVGCDGSSGMLRRAAARCAPELDAGRLELFVGQAQELAPTSFGRRAFDLIFSTIGGFAYLDDAGFVDAHRALAEMLAPGGLMVLAHLTPFCLAESAYHLARLAPRAAVKRWRGVVPIEVRGQPMTMHLRSPRRLRRLLTGTVRIERLLPLLVWTPPFQTGFQPRGRVLSWLERLERAATASAPLAALADQAVCVARRL